MIEPNTTGWEPVGESSNSRYFVPRAGLLVAVPRAGSSDTFDSASENVAFQVGHFRSRGESGAVIVYFDYLVSQDVAARRVYQTVPDPRYMLGTALVGGTLLSRAMGSFFLGLARPAIPVQMFGSFQDAAAWGDGLRARAASKGDEGERAAESGVGTAGRDVQR